MKETLKLIKSQQKSNLFYFNYFTRFISIYLSYFFIKIRTKPNTITFLMIIPGIIGSYLLSFGDSVMYLFAGMFLVLHDILDTSDGEVARFLNLKSSFGVFLDNVSHFIVNSSIVFFSTMGLFKNIFLNFAEYQYVVSIIFLILAILDQYIKILNKMLISVNRIEIYENNKSLKYLINEILFGNMAFFHLILILGLMGFFIPEIQILSQLYIITYVLLNSYKLIVKFKFAKRKFI